MNIKTHCRAPRLPGNIKKHVFDWEENIKWDKTTSVRVSRSENDL